MSATLTPGLAEALPQPVAVPDSIDDGPSFDPESTATVQRQGRFGRWHDVASIPFLRVTWLANGQGQVWWGTYTATEPMTCRGRAPNGRTSSPTKIMAGDRIQFCQWT